MPGKLKIILNSFLYYRKHVFYQLLIILLLSAVITGSLLTGSSVRNSLKNNAHEHLGNTDFLISSGLRYFDPELITDLNAKGLNCTGLFELAGSCRSFSDQKTAMQVNIIFTETNFFQFNNSDSSGQGRNSGIAINKKLADQLAVKEGDELLIRFRKVSDIPPDAPFAPSTDEQGSVVRRIERIIEPSDGGNFSLLISQIDPLNIFIPSEEFENLTGNSTKFNRILISHGENLTTEKINVILKSTLSPDDIGLKIRRTTGSQAELLSSRVFIDENLVKSIRELLPFAEPVLTYLANKIEKDSSVTPYSFVSGVSSNLYPFSDKNGIVINSWLSTDLNAKIGDSLKLYWYSPDSLNHLAEKSRYFYVMDIVQIKDKYADSLLMPDFPGIAASESCSAWDAGLPVKIKNIRAKDEAYWKKYRGTPKAFISYETAKEIWGSNYGVATSIRFESNTPQEIEETLTGKINTDLSGFSVRDIYKESIIAAENSVDFGSLFIGLGFFLIVASMVLLSFSMSYYLTVREADIKTLHALGFRNHYIRNLLFYETSVTGFAGCFLGALTGYFINVFITAALNSVWTDAVQTDALQPYFDFASIFSGFIITLIIIMLYIYLEAGRYLRRLHTGKKQKLPATNRNGGWLLIISLASAAIFQILSFQQGKNSVIFAFLSGILLFSAMILAWREYFIYPGKSSSSHINVSRLYYRSFPSHATAPVLFIAAGIFAFFITSVNRKSFSEDMTNNSSGTGGYLFWCESGIPIMDDLSEVQGRKSAGFEDTTSLRFVMMKRSPGNDASCLNLNYITAPVLLGLNPSDFISGDRFSFASVIKNVNQENPWEMLSENPGENTIYGIADQTVLEWGLKIGVGDTVIMRSEQGKPLKIIIAAGLKPSVFQGNVVISSRNLVRYFPSVPGNSVMLVMGNSGSADYYKNLLEERLSGYDVHIEKTSDRLSSFYRVTNTYLSVFGILGGLGLMTGIAGLGFVLLRNYNQRKREFSLMLAVGFTIRKIRKMILSGQMLILVAGISTGVISATIATLPSLNSGQEIPWLNMILIIIGIFITGTMSVVLAVRSVRMQSLTETLRKE